MKVAPRLLVPVLALSLVAVSCRSGSPGESAATPPTTSITPSTTTTPDVDPEPPLVAPGFAGIELGGLADFGLRLGSFPDYVPAPPGEGPTFELLDCREVWPRLYILDFEWIPTADVQLPFRAHLKWAFTSSDSISYTTYDIVLDAGGRFSVPIDARLDSFPPTEGLWNGRRSPFREGLFCYGGPFGDGISTGQQSSGAAPRVEPVDLSTDAPPGTLQELVASIVPGDVSDPLLPLADLYARSTDLPIDRVYLDPNNTLEVIQVRVEASCVTVDSAYEDGLEVYQSRGCEITTHPWYQETYPIRFEDEAWLIGVKGGDRTQLDVVPIHGTEILGEEGKFFDPDAWLDATLETEAVTEIARLAFKDGRVSLIVGVEENHPFLREVIVGMGSFDHRDIRGVDEWESCARWGVHETSAGTFLLVVTSDPSWRIEALLDQWTSIEIKEASGFGVGLIELDEPISTPDLRGYESDESSVTCLARIPRSP